MAYRLRVYAPSAGISRIRITIDSRNYTGDPAGDSTPAWDSQTDYGGTLTSDARISATAESGYEISACIVRIDDYSYELPGMSSYTYTYSESDSNIFVRFEVTEVVQYSVTLEYDANGGSGAPRDETWYGEDPSGYVDIYISEDIPTRDGYTFLGWAWEDPDATRPTHYPGDHDDAWGSENGEVYTLYAVWEEALSDGAVWIYHGGSWKRYMVFVCRNGTWRQVVPYVYHNGSWQRCT